MAGAHDKAWPPRRRHTQRTGTQQGEGAFATSVPLVPAAPVLCTPASAAAKEAVRRAAGRSASESKRRMGGQASQRRTHNSTPSLCCLCCAHLLDVVHEAFSKALDKLRLAGDLGRLGVGKGAAGVSGGRQRQRRRWLRLWGCRMDAQAHLLSQLLCRLGGLELLRAFGTWGGRCVRGLRAAGTGGRQRRTGQGGGDGRAAYLLC